MPEDSIGKRIATYRRRRGMSQAALAGLIGRSESWLSQVERGVRSVDRMSVLLDLSRLLHVDVQALTGTPWQLAPNGGQRAEGIESVRTALNQYTGLLGGNDTVPELAEVRRSASEAHTNYQAARYASVVRDIPKLIANADAALLHSGTDDREAALSYVETYVVASKLLTKLGVGDLGAVTADRAAMAAGRANSPAAQGMAVYQVVTALLRSDQVDQAEQLAMRMAGQLGPAVRSDDPALVSVTGALWLIAAVIAARRTEQWEAERRLAEASALADLLGHDANYAWTAFGPTNVAIHRVSVAAELGNPGGALDAAAAVDLDALPTGLSSRRAQVNLDLAWAQAQRRRDAEATLNLLAAEKAAPEAVAQNVVAREIMRMMLARAKRGNGNALQALATRAGVLD
ncbi:MULTISPECIES: helix-turn-helix transcriptional regulator [unclassified Pseudonocardia]|uniref:helix-turn-helix domain-containing protein n=1 Tax=unclassified Pseudonocardia TaxID=2619320 RepID=UPI0001FFE6C0|nr:helix-turn-helix transcriptional regulator [Pseudonocardia sp. Ae707_Ps1]OLM18213.1 putative transcriptional regulator [Pseudonocardia sp. Ae707_Ps1]